VLMLVGGPNSSSKQVDIRSKSFKFSSSVGLFPLMMSPRLRMKCGEGFCILIKCWRAERSFWGASLYRWRRPSTPPSSLSSYWTSATTPNANNKPPSVGEAGMFEFDVI